MVVWSNQKSLKAKKSVLDYYLLNELFAYSFGDTVKYDIFPGFTFWRVYNQK